MTDRTKIEALAAMLVVALAGLAFVLVFSVGDSDANKNSPTAVCPDGQRLAVVKVNDGEGGLRSGGLPPELAERGYTLETGVGGSGANYRVSITEDSAQVWVERATKPIGLEIGCEPTTR